MRFAIIAQGGGYYGCAFFTIDGTREEITTKLSRHPGYHPSSQNMGSIEIGDDSFIFIREFAGEAQPTPVLLFDSGHTDEDMAALTGVRSYLI